jgi:pSer/pThr/pTyr-binding forkhead associated (FHA) protein
MRSEQGNDVVEIDQPEAIVGRHSSADVRVAGADVSRRHCQIAFVDGSWRVRDLGSLNGVFVNNERIDAAPLKVGDRLRMGNITYIIERSGAPKPPRRDLLKSIAQAFEGDGMTALG